MAQTAKTNSKSTMKIENGELIAVVSETKSTLNNIQSYENMITTMLNVGRQATLKIVEAIARVHVTGMFKASTDENGIPFDSINKWAMEKFNFSKAHVSEILSVAKHCSDPETGIIRSEFAGLSYTQLLALTKNPKVLTTISNGDVSTQEILNNTAKEIKNLIPVVEDNGNITLQLKGNQEGTPKTEDGNDNTPKETDGNDLPFSEAEDENEVELHRSYSDIKGAESSTITLTISKNGKATIEGYDSIETSFKSELEALRYILSGYQLIEGNRPE